MLQYLNTPTIGQLTLMLESWNSNPFEWKSFSIKSAINNSLRKIR